MLDQSFSSMNFNFLFLKENRKGNFDKSHFTPEYLEKHQEFKTVLKAKIDLKIANGSLTKIELDEFAERLERINKEKEEIRLSIFQEFANTINSSTNPFKFKIEYNTFKKVYTVEKDPASYYAVKQLQFNINKTFKVIQSDRNRIIKQIFNIVSDGFPKIIIKTDIKSFYESIPQEKLFEKIEENTLLSPYSKKLIRRLFYEFEEIKDKAIIPLKKGVPRGIGLSAYLSELFMREIDSEIKKIEDVIYYARYVDDIIVIFSPKTQTTKGNYLDDIRQIICNRNGLMLKDGSDGDESKTFEINLPNRNSYTEFFNFLGYSFNLKRSEITVSGQKKSDFKAIIEISNNKIERYEKRLIAAIETYNKDSLFNEKESRKMLFERLKFLTGNFHLNNNKKNVKSGVYYSNEMLRLNTEKYTSLKYLDKKLSNALSLLAPPPKIGINKVKLKLHLMSKFSFQKGFLLKEKYFYSFTFSDRERNYYYSKFGRTTNKFEVIKSIWK